jgi:hypothetical protein
LVILVVELGKKEKKRKKKREENVGNHSSIHAFGKHLDKFLSVLGGHFIYIHEY